MIRTKFIHAGEYAAEVQVELTETDDAWSPYLSVEEANKLDDIREALRRGDIRAAARNARIFTLTPVAAQSTGTSVCILGIEDKKYLAETYGKDLGKATVTGYCIRFKTLKDINIDVLEAAIRFGFENQNEKASN